jgi:hypothetical protein
VEHGFGGDGRDVHSSPLVRLVNSSAHVLLEVQALTHPIGFAVLVLSDVVVHVHPLNSVLKVSLATVGFSHHAADPGNEGMGFRSLWLVVVTFARAKRSPSPALRKTPNLVYSPVT